MAKDKQSLRSDDLKQNLRSKDLDKKTVKDLVSQTLKLLNIDGTFEVAEGEEGYDVTLSTEDAALVIGYHGDTLESLQIILSLILSKKLGEFKRVSLEVGEYKKNRSEWLTSLAQETRERVISENRQIILPDLKAWERRVVHMLLQDDPEVVSESVGEGKDRVLVIKPKS